jgi:hypothetical protein
MKLLERVHASTESVVYELIDVTPEIARYWLTLNTDNRRLNPASVARFASDMTNNRWKHNGESIKFDRENRLIDGQHRLAAMIQANVSLRFLVVKNLDPETQHTIDVGVSRTSAQIAGMMGVSNPNDITVLAHALMRYERYRDVVWSSNTIATKPDIVQFTLANNEDLQRANSYAQQARRAVRMKASPYGLLAFHVLRQYDEGTWLLWHERVVDGVGLSQIDPRLVLRNQIMRRDGRQGLWQQQEIVGWVIKAWNAWRTHREIKLIRYTRDELPLPEIL